MCQNISEYLIEKLNTPYAELDIEIRMRELEQRLAIIEYKT